MAVKADADGRFRLDGLRSRARRGAGDRLSGYRTERVEVITRPGRSPFAIDGISPIDGRPIIRYDAAQFVHQIPDIATPDPDRLRECPPPGKTDRFAPDHGMALQADQPGDEAESRRQPEEADLILEGTINEPRKAPPDQPDGPRP